MKKLVFLTPALLAAGLLALSCGGQTPPKAEGPAFVGTVFDQKSPAADFTLTDQHGNPVTLSSFKGRPVVISFIYTHCGDICPYVALKMKEAQTILGPDADKAVWLAITTDPKRDTVPVMADYSRALGLFDKWSFLTSDVDKMNAVYKSYHIAVASATAEEAEETQKNADELGMKLDTHGHDAAAPARGLSDGDLKIASDVIKKFSGGYEVAHSTPFWFIDKEGNVKISLGAEAFPKEIAQDVKLLSL